MSSQNRPSLSEKLPEELMSMIFSELTVVQLARAQRTCKRWYNIAQKNSTLWTDAAPFFNHIEKWQDPGGKRNSILWMDTAPFFYHTQKWQGSGRKKILLQLRGLRKLKELSNNRLDGIVLQSDFNNKLWGYGSLRQIIFEALREHPPTRLTIMKYNLETRNQGRQDDPCLELLAKNESLKHLYLHAITISSSFPWQLKLACSLESLDLKCPRLSNYSNKEEMMISLMNVKKMKLHTILQRPGNLEFLDKIGQNLEELELIEWTPSYATGEPINEKKTIIRFPNLLKLTLDSPSHKFNDFYQLDCPQLQSLTVREALNVPMVGLSRPRLHEQLLSTDTITHVSISLPSYVSRKSSDVILNSSAVILKLFFRKFRHIEEMHVKTRSQSTLQDLVKTLPKTVSKLNITLEVYHDFDRTFLKRLRDIRKNGEVEKKVKRDKELDCTLSVLDVYNQDKEYDVTIFGRTNLRALVFGRGK